MTILPGDVGTVPIQVEGTQPDGEYVVMALRHEEQGSWVAIPTTLLHPGDGQLLEVSNIGGRPVIWKSGHLLARADPCERSPAQVQLVAGASPGPGSLNLSAIKVGDIGKEERAQLDELLT